MKCRTVKGEHLLGILMALNGTQTHRTTGQNGLFVSASKCILPMSLCLLLQTKLPQNTSILINVNK